MIAQYTNLVNGIYTRQLRMGMLALDYRTIPGLVSLMNFDNNSALGESSTVAVDEKNQNNATVNAPTSTSGYKGGAMQFVAGDDNYVLLNNLISSSADFTFSVWFFLYSTVDQTIVANSGDVNGYIIIRDNLTVGVNLGSPPGTEELFTFTDVIMTSVWNNLIVTRTAGDVRVYINNVESSTGAITNTGTFAFDLIGTSNAHDLLTNAKLDVLAFWDRAISQDSRTEIYERTRGVADFERNVPPGCKTPTIATLQVTASGPLLPGNSVAPFCRPANPFFGLPWNGLLANTTACVWWIPAPLKSSWNGRLILPTLGATALYFDTVWIFRIRPHSFVGAPTSVTQYWTKNYGTNPYGVYLPDSVNCNPSVTITVT